MYDFHHRSPQEERPVHVRCLLDEFAFQSTLPSQGATDGLAILKHAFFISIHAPLTGSD